MKILHILNHVKQTGNGIVNVAVDLACLQAQQGHHVYVASSGGNYTSLLESYDVQHLLLDQTRTPLNLFQGIRQYANFVKTLQPDVIHAHMMTGIILSVLLKRLGRYSIISTVHNEFQKSSILMGLADRVIAVSDEVAISMRKRGVKTKKLRVVRNGTLGSPRAKRIQDYAPIDLCRPAILTIAGMYERKGIADLIKAFEQVAFVIPDVHLYLVGDGPERQKFEKMAQQCTSISHRIHFEGFQSEPQRYLLSADIFVLASHQDPCPLVIPEAREAGCAIIASQVDGIPELLEAGKAGWLVGVKSSGEIATAIVKLLSDQDLLQEFRSKAQQNLSWLRVDRVVEETLAVYAEVV